MVVCKKVLFAPIKKLYLLHKIMHFAEKCIFFCIFLYKNLHISKICCNFAPSFKKESTRTPKRKPKIEIIMETKKKITKATFKSFVAKNIKNLYSVCFSDFDGMQDCVTAVEQKLKKVTSYDWSRGYGDCGIPNIWLVGGGDDYFREIEYKGMKGIECFNCCGSWAVVTK